MLKVVPWGLLRDPPSRNEGTKKREDRDHEQEEEWSDLGEGSF